MTEKKSSVTAMPKVQPKIATCANCGAPLSARFCGRCGQDSHVTLSVKHFFEEFIEGVLHFDSTFWRTFLPLLFKPGLLTAQFLSGKRKAYAPPLRSYLVLSIVYFLVSSLTSTLNTRFVGPGGQELHAADCPAIAQRMVLIRKFIPNIETACVRALSDNGRAMSRATVGLLPKVMFVVLPLVALVQFWMYRRQRPLYVENLIFILHFQSFFFLAGACFIFLELLGSWLTKIGIQGVATWLDPVIYVWAAIYLFIANRRVYATGKVKAIVSILVLGLAYAVFWWIGIAFASVYAFINA